MSRLAMFVAVATVAVIFGAGVVHAQQPAQRSPQATRSYRSYSVSPSTRANAPQRSRGASDATWRHAEAKPTGQFHGGR